MGKQRSNQYSLTAIERDCPNKLQSQRDRLVSDSFSLELQRE